MHFPALVKRCLIALVPVLLAPVWLSVTPAATLERLTLDDMIAKSTAIVRAKVTTSFVAASGPVVYTHYQLQVMEQYKGQPPATIDLAVFGGVAGNIRQVYSGSPQFSGGDEYVFFLWTSKSGLTQVIGLTQGIFSIAPSGEMDPALTRVASHELMLDPHTRRPIQDLTLQMRLSELKTKIKAATAGPVAQ